MPTRKPYTRAFTIAAVTLVMERGLPRTQAARDRGVDLTPLRRWIAEFEADGARAFPGQGHTREEELARLLHENELLRQERDSLKKASGICSRMTQ